MQVNSIAIIFNAIFQNDGGTKKQKTVEISKTVIDAKNTYHVCMVFLCPCKTKNKKQKKEEEEVVITNVQLKQAKKGRGWG